MDVALRQSSVLWSHNDISRYCFKICAWPWQKIQQHDLTPIACCQSMNNLCNSIAIWYVFVCKNSIFIFGHHFESEQCLGIHQNLKPLALVCLIEIGCLTGNAILNPLNNYRLNHLKSFNTSYLWFYYFTCGCWIKGILHVSRNHAIFPLHISLFPCCYALLFIHI